MLPRGFLAIQNSRQFGSISNKSKVHTWCRYCQFCIMHPCEEKKDCCRDFLTLPRILRSLAQSLGKKRWAFLDALKSVHTHLSYLLRLRRNKIKTDVLHIFCLFVCFCNWTASESNTIIAVIYHDFYLTSLQWHIKDMKGQDCHMILLHKSQKLMTQFLSQISFSLPICGTARSRHLSLSAWWMTSLSHLYSCCFWYCHLVHLFITVQLLHSRDIKLSYYNEIWVWAVIK